MSGESIVQCWPLIQPHMELLDLESKREFSSLVVPASLRSNWWKHKRMQPSVFEFVLHNTPFKMAKTDNKQNGRYKFTIDK